MIIRLGKIQEKPYGGGIHKTRNNVTCHLFVSRFGNTLLYKEESEIAKKHN